jgi:hypothetical protein
MNMKTAAIIAAMGLGLGLTACETATPYQPLERGTSILGGFTDQRLDADHFRVSFQGDPLTSRATVETYLLYRAAELTTSQGFDWFETTDRHTDRDRRTYLDPDPCDGPCYAGGHNGGFGWRSWGPFWGDTAEVETVQKFEATAEIAMHHGPKPEGDPKALISNLGPKIERPHH